jgi:crotonobetainyl-CoA:carnitine CoA-transferase CaiB-like acyl-CoA transferase
VTAICDGLRVVEMGAGSVPASLAGMVLADHGARVVKIEPPEGDRLRTVHPSGAAVWNRGKESVVADLRTTEGQAAVRELARNADVVIEAFAPGRADEWGVGSDALRAENPGLVYCAISGFGPTGPYAHLKGYEALVCAKSGLFSRGEFAPRRGPAMFPQNFGGFGAAMLTVGGVLAALLVREQTGRGQRLDTSLLQGLDPVDYFMTTIYQMMVRNGGEPPPLDAAAMMSANRYGVIVCTKDGRFIQTSTVLPHQAKALCEAAGIAHVLDDPKFKGLPMFETAEDAQEWEDLLWAAFRERDLAEWLPVLEAYDDVAFEVARTSEEGLDHPQIQHNGDVVTVDDPEHGPMRQVSPLGHFETTPAGPPRPAPALGNNAGPFAPRPAPTGSDAGAPAHPLAGVTIVEFGYFYAMPYGTAIAAALGARVIKIEDASGDPMRISFGPEMGSVKTTAGKESLSIDLSNEEGRELARRVIDGADVFLTGFRSGVAERNGFGYEELSKRNPRLLYVHAAGYGTDGPYAKRALYAQAAQAVGGSFGRQVGAWLAPERNLDMSVLELQVVVAPRLAHIVDGDSNAALAVFGTLMLGIYHQQRTGRGQFLRTSMIGGNALAYSDDFCSYADKPPVPICDDEYFGTHALYRLYEAAPGWICLAATTDREWRSLATAIERPELVDDPKFATGDARREHDDDLVQILRETFSARPAHDWESVLTEARVGCVDVGLAGYQEFASTDAGLREAGTTVEVAHPLFGRLVRFGPPVVFSETPWRLAPSCLRGEHNRAVLAELGYEDRQIDDLEARGVLFPPDPLPDQSGAAS